MAAIKEFRIQITNDQIREKNPDPSGLTSIMQQYLYGNKLKFELISIDMQHVICITGHHFTING